MATILLLLPINRFMFSLYCSLLQFLKKMGLPLLYQMLCILLGSVMVSSLLLPPFGTLSLLLYFWLPSTSLPSKSRSIATLGIRWHDFFFFFFFTLFRYFINLFYSFQCLSFPFLKGCGLEKGHLVPVLCSHS